jgi:hypothetical protein
MLERADASFRGMEMIRRIWWGPAVSWGSLGGIELDFMESEEVALFISVLLRSDSLFGPGGNRDLLFGGAGMGAHRGSSAG